MNFLGASLSLYITEKIVTPYVPIIVASIFAIINIVVTIALILVAYKKLRKYKFKILTIKVNFEYMGDRVRITTEACVRAKRSNLNSIYNRYSWFPDEKSYVKCLTAGMKIKKLPKRDTSIEYKVLFGKTLRKGEEITYTTQVICENKHKHFNDFYSRKIIAPIDHLTMTVVIPSEYGYNKIECSKILDSAYNDSSCSKTFDFLNTYTWDVEEVPKLGYEYKLLWKKG